LDLVIRWFGQRYGFDATGTFMLLELKYGNASLGVPQEKLWRLIDGLLRRADPCQERYFGFYLVQYSDNDWDKASFRINYRPVSRIQFIEFWERKFIVNSLFEAKP
jgi:hypothetical protein